MEKKLEQLSDEDFLAQFENQTLDEQFFDHIGHLRLAWLYLNQNTLDDAIALVCDGIKTYAESLGVNTKFHLTITDATVRIMSRRIDFLEDRTWQLFLDNNDDLIEDLLAVLLQHFSKPLLFSEKARIALVKPDLQPL